MNARVLLAFFGVAVAVLAVAAAPADQMYADYTFEQFLADHKPDVLLTNTPYEYTARRAIFEANLAKIRAHNADPFKTYTLAVNKFADLTEKEFVQRYTGNAGNPSKQSRFVGRQRFEVRATPELLGYPESFDWRDKGMVGAVKNQGQCGSCWAFASAAAFEAHALIHTSKKAVVSTQQITSCTPNPRKCGGGGGCTGATTELAYDYLASAGTTSKEAYPDTSDRSGQTGACKYDPNVTPPIFSSTGYHQVTSNNATAHYDALVNQGPLAISVAANDLMFYSSGVFSGCPTSKNVDINHAVVMVGYGVDKGLKYWSILNSWGTSWGEKGYFRVVRKDVEECGTDSTPQHGVACEGETDPVTVCGTCGVLYDSTYPTGIKAL